jgi:hypothetical protein
VNARLEAAVQSAAQLPDELQAEIAARIEEEMDDLAWKAQLNDPRSQAVLDQLEAQLDADIAAGAVYHWPEDQADDDQDSARSRQ